MGVRFGPDGRGVADEIREQWQGSNAANAVAAQATAVGPFAEERVSIDADAFDGPILESVEVAPDSVTGPRLTQWALARRRLLSQPSVLGFSVPPGDKRVVGLGVGDLVDVDVDYGALQIRARYRVTRKVWDPSADTATFSATYWEVLP
jgi:hypothetical protein